MKQLFKRIFLTSLALSLLNVSALAESVSLDGTVTAAYTHEVYAAASGIVESVSVTAGQNVTAGDEVAALRTTKVYAEVDGTVSAVFARAGSLTDTVAERYGACVYLESDVTYTVSASTENAYDSVETKVVYVGEQIYLRSRSDSARAGVGVITGVDGSAYTVQVTDGSFKVGESVNLYRDAAFTDTQRVGRGDVGRNAPVAVTASGRVASVAVTEGQSVTRGALLMETLDGSAADPSILAGEAGVVAEINVEPGATVSENAVVAVIWPAEAMQIEALINESDLASISIGDTVSLAFDWSADSAEPVSGVVRSISALSDSASEDTCFRVRIDFEPDASIRYGMNVTIATMD